MEEEQSANEVFAAFDAAVAMLIQEGYAEPQQEDDPAHFCRISPRGLGVAAAVLLIIAGSDGLTQAQAAVVEACLLTLEEAYGFMGGAV